jgi:alpha-glucoside transport system substrate-binding protein
MPTLGDLEEYAADHVLKPLDEILPGADYGPPWTPAPDSGALLYWVPVRVGLKSIVWFDSRRHSPGDLPGLAADGDRWCVGMGSDATSGWPGTDWIEDILLQQAGPETYERWTVGEDLAWTDPQVRKAWRTWAELLTKGVAPDAPGRALTTDFRDAGIRPKDNRCRLEHQGSFIRDVEARRRADFVPFAGFLPETASTARVYEVSADMAALFRDTGESRKLLRYLVKDSTQRALGARAGTLSANRGVPPEAYRPSATGEKLARTLRDADARCLDASDAMPAAMRHAFQRAVLEYLSLQQGMADRGIADPMKVLEGLDQVQRSVRDQAHPPAADICG